ncbi:membrane lipoprotein lipid attachment site-containing protein [Pasteurella skyensis]|uniref:Membrane lipoprotein lipid attachment site-containing protein n=1 Tax=Phocoenobacter skyensis TaxID=97481 RepID=A0AAJ6N8S0_9PAST|nr:membrane lipoprotein lipid attachment site-containing protein [Pasteurella skyensis]MDP8162379.1 membrane lipoprotein lipid attachment site-containing protein [Pasteurella skyensis]MDP8172287.1 membrane lipoprotein lipid attachment site-containing protein [Pasteurella skyensis]MDP8178542.1 membrane lipoprotein lipid attachment site-containing protein [Pasteurella skyensis]MDP8182544.1 membrane lipoprotein lipid attachment site-containing protein [Pasteurella skyensis]MDP8188849.1 membrane l
MKKLITALLLTIILTACSENFDIKDPTEFNQKIEKRTDIKTAEQLIEIYYNYPPNEGIPKLDIKSKNIGNGLTEITLIHDMQEDDSQRATKIVMEAELKNKKWIVHQIKTNRKCWEGRGHTDWGTEWCR